MIRVHFLLVVSILCFFGTTSMASPPSESQRLGSLVEVAIISDQNLSPKLRLELIDTFGKIDDEIDWLSQSQQTPHLTVSDRFYCLVLRMMTVVRSEWQRVRAIDRQPTKEIVQQTARQMEKELRRNLSVIFGAGEKDAIEIWLPAMSSALAFYLHLAPLAQSQETAILGGLFQAASLLYFNANEKQIKERWSKSPVYNLKYANWWSIRKTLALGIMMGFSQEFFQGKILLAFEGGFLANLVTSPGSNVVQAVRNKWPRSGKFLQSYVWNMFAKPNLSVPIIEAFTAIQELRSFEHAQFVVATASAALLASYGASLVRNHVLHSEKRYPMPHTSARNLLSSAIQAVKTFRSQNPEAAASNSEQVTQHLTDIQSTLDAHEDQERQK